MASGRDYLTSIIASCGKLQLMSDSQLDSVKDGLERVDDELIEGIEYLGE